MNNWLSITSSAFKQVRYDETTRLLDVQFHNGTITRYHRVPHRVHIKLVGHASPGTYLNEGVKPFFDAVNLPSVPDVTEE